MLQSAYIATDEDEGGKDVDVDGFGLATDSASLTVIASHWPGAALILLGLGPLLFKVYTVYGRKIQVPSTNNESWMIT